MNCIKNGMSRTDMLYFCSLMLLLVIMFFVTIFSTALDTHAQESEHTLWSADHEIYDDNGDCDTSLNEEYEIVDDATGISSYEPNILRQWELGQLGRVSFNTPDFSEASPEDATVDASERYAHNGRCSLKMTIRNADAGEIRAVRIFKRWLYSDNLPNGYYSSWYYLPDVYQTADFWNIFQFKSHYPTIIDGNYQGQTSGSMLSFNLESIPAGSSNPTHYNLYVHHKLPQSAYIDSCDVNENNPEECRQLQYYDQGNGENSEPLKIPANSWFQIKAYFVQSGSTVTGRDGSTAIDGTVQSNGALKVWITLLENGDSTEHLIISKENIPTLMFPEARSTWSVNSYTNYMPDSTITLYVDDAKISSCDGLYQESEDAEWRSGFLVGTSPNASGGEYLYVDDASTDDTSRIAYCFRVNRSGIYRLKGWATGPDDSGDSFYVATEDDPDNRYYWGIPTGSDFVGEYVVDQNSGEYIELSLDPGEHQLFVYPRETAAQVDRLALEWVGDDPSADPFEGECGPLIQEAEDGILSGNFVLGKDENASNGQYIYTTTASETEGPDRENQARFCFTVPEDGIYYIKGWVYAADARSNSLYVTVNNSPSTGYKWHTIDFRNQDDISYRADHVINRTAENYVVLNLESGPQLVTFYPREAGIRLDKVALAPTTASLLAMVAAENDALGFVRDTEDDVDGTQHSSYNLYLPFGMNIP